MTSFNLRALFGVVVVVVVVIVVVVDVVVVVVDDDDVLRVQENPLIWGT